MSVKNWTTTRIKAVLDESYLRGTNGADYEDIHEELQAELWERLNKRSQEKEIAMQKDLEEYERFLRSVQPKTSIA